MKSLLLAILIPATLAVAQVNSIPACAQPCYNYPTTCLSYDYKCLCQDHSYRLGVYCCVVGDCDQSDVNAAVEYGIQICEQYGITAGSLSTSIACGTSTAAAAAPTGASSSMAASMVTGTAITLSPSSASTTFLTASVATAAAAAPNGAATSASAASGGLDQDTKIGIGLGVGLGVPLLAGLAVGIYFVVKLIRSINQGGQPIREDDISPQDAVDEPRVQSAFMHPKGGSGAVQVTNVPWAPSTFTSPMTRMDPTVVSEHPNQV